MDMNNDESPDIKTDDVVKAEVTKGEQDDVLEDFPQSETERVRRTPSPKLVSKDLKHDVSKKRDVKMASARIEELARPKRQRVLVTLHERASTLSPAFVDNLIRTIEVESCLTPEQAAQVLRRKKRKVKKIDRFSPFMKKLVKEVTKPDMAHVMTLDKDATMHQYLMAERFADSVLRWQCRIPKKKFCDIARVIVKRLTTLDEYESIRNDIQATQLHLLADIIACWIIELSAEVETHNEIFKKHHKQMKLMKKIEVEKYEETDSEIEVQKQEENEGRKKKEAVKKEGDIEGKNEKREDKQNEVDIGMMREEQNREEKQLNEKDAEEEYESPG